jgi:hypothetical protein
VSFAKTCPQASWFVGFGAAILPQNLKAPIAINLFRKSKMAVCSGAPSALRVNPISKCILTRFGLQLANSPTSYKPVAPWLRMGHR